MIYVDMDGVLANLYDYISLRMFQKTFTNLQNTQIEVLKTIFRDKLYFNHVLKEGAEKVFENLEQYPFNQTLIETVTKFGGEYSILSRPSTIDLEGTKRAKIKWIETHLSFCPPKDIILVQDKTSNGRAPGNVLIDDFDPFLERWREKGGKAIEFKAWKYSNNMDVTNYIAEKLQEAIK